MSKRPIDRALEWAKTDGLNQSDLARRAGVLPQDITNWKKRDLPSDKYIVMADALNRSVDDLLGRTGYRRSSVLVADTHDAPGKCWCGFPSKITLENASRGAPYPPSLWPP